jgi:hypothetical protein
MKISVDLRKKYEKEVRSYKKKIEYLSRILAGGKRGGHAEDRGSA